MYLIFNDFTIINLIMKRYYLIFSILLIGFGCKNSEKSYDLPIVIFNLKDITDLSTIKLTDLGIHNIEYVALETNEQSIFSFTDNVLVGSVPPIKIIADKSFLLIKQFNNILKFQYDGKFLAKIGTVGRGPEEFTVAHDLDIRTKDKNVFLVSGWQKKINIYSSEGLYLKSFNIPLYAPVDMRIAGDNILCYCENHMGNIENSYTLLDTNGLVIKSFPNKFPFVNHDAFIFQHENIFYRFNNQLFKKEVYSDTIYVFDKMEFKPHMVIQAGDKLVTPEARSEYSGMEIAEKYIQPLNLMEFGDYVYYDFIYSFVANKELTTYGFVGSKTNGFQALFNKSIGILNDLDGGPGIIPWAMKDDETLLSLIDALSLKSYVASDEFKKTEPKYPEMKKELEKFVFGLKETDNPVLILATLKR